jgi:hypothetical protein
MKPAMPLISFEKEEMRSSCMSTASVIGERGAPRVARISCRSPSS